MMGDWIIIFAAILLCEMYWHPLIYLLAIAVIGGRQHGLGILGHEAVHYRLFNSKTLNDWVADLFIAWPLLFTTSHFRSAHFRHHNHLGTLKDPDRTRRAGNEEWVFPMTKKSFYIILIKDISGLNFYQNVARVFKSSKKDPELKKISKKLPRSYLIIIGLYFALMTVSFYYFGIFKLFLIYWIIPLMTWLKLAKRLRAVAEHFGLESHKSRTIYLNFFERAFIAPHNVNYHYEHHVHPSVPWFRLKELHQVMLTKNQYSDDGHITKGYFRGLIQEISRI